MSHTKFCFFSCIFSQVGAPLAASTPNSCSSVGKKGSSKSLKKSKAVRRLQFDEDKSSPVSGTIIRDIGTVRDERNQLLLSNQDEKYEETPLGIQVLIYTLICIFEIFIKESMVRS